MNPLKRMMTGPISWQDFQSIQRRLTASRKKKGLNPKSPAPSHSTSRSPSHSPGHSQSEREPLNLGICRYLKAQDATAAEISAHLEQKRVSGQLKIVLKEMIVRGLIEYSIPDKPRSRLQAKRVIDAVPETPSPSRCATTGLKTWIGSHAAGSWIRPASWRRCGRGGKMLLLS